MKTPAQEAIDAADGALLLLFVDRTYGTERAAAIVAACSRFIAERERELADDPEPERDTLPATLFWCECPELTPDPDKPELCAVCARLLRSAVSTPNLDEVSERFEELNTRTVAMLKCPCGFHGPINDDGSCPRCGADE